VGQAVFANMQTNQVSLNNGTPCCDIVSVTPLLAAPIAGATTSATSSARSKSEELSVISATR
jgi:hypothetical protein